MADLGRELSDQDYGELAATLSRIDGGKIQSLEALDGFPTALIICT